MASHSRSEGSKEREREKTEKENRGGAFRSLFLKSRWDASPLLSLSLCSSFAEGGSPISRGGKAVSSFFFFLLLLLLLPPRWTSSGSNRRARGCTLRRSVFVIFLCHAELEETAISCAWEIRIPKGGAAREPEATFLCLPFFGDVHSTLPFGRTLDVELSSPPLVSSSPLSPPPGPPSLSLRAHTCVLPLNNHTLKKTKRRMPPSAPLQRRPWPRSAAASRASGRARCAIAVVKLRERAARRKGSPEAPCRAGLFAL